MIIIHTDGGARGNPGPAAAGYTIDRDHEHITGRGVYLGNSLTNNWAEYEALYLALSHCVDLRLVHEPITALLDSKLVVEQVMGNWKIKEPSLRDQYTKIKELLRAHSIRLTCRHIPREENKRADAFVNKALDEHVA